MRLCVIILSFGFLYAQSPSEWWNGWYNAKGEYQAGADSSQKASIRGSYDRNKQYDKGWTLAALNAIESSGGLHLLRLGEDSAGLYAQRGKYVARRVYKTKKPTVWQISRVVQRLIQERDFDDEQARKHLDELLDRYKGDWMLTWQAWNGHKTHQAEDVRAWVRFLVTQFK